MKSDEKAERSISGNMREKRDGSRLLAFGIWTVTIFPAYIRENFSNSKLQGYAIETKHFQSMKDPSGY
jgi:hypothetical protein